MFSYFVVGILFFALLSITGAFLWFSIKQSLFDGILLEHWSWGFLASKDERRDFLQSLSDIKDSIVSVAQNFGRVYVALFVAWLIGLLLYLKVITPDAGLPLLAGISGFAIGNTSSPRSSSSGPAQPSAARPPDATPPDGPRRDGDRMRQS
ncbi:MAG TPA: hypothetical protein VGG48_01320 [Rhizomicrobium sp.]|jgi:hypothetical protein